MQKLTIIASLSLLAVAVSTSASATGHHGHRYQHCGSNNSQPSQCESPLGENTYDLMKDGIASGVKPNANSSIDIAGVNVSVSSWADTRGGFSYDDGRWGYNNKVTSAGELDKFSGGYGVSNEQDGRYWHDHAIDNHSASYYGADATDYDFLLFSFDSDVTLTGASFGWAENKYNTQVSVAGLSDISALTSGSSTWKDVLQQSVTAGSFDVTYCDPGYTSAFNFTSSAQYWLVGAYNTVFGDIGGTLRDDAFKLSALGFNRSDSAGPGPSTQVSEPTTLGLLVAGGLFAGWRKQRNNKQKNNL